MNVILQFKYIVVKNILLSLCQTPKDNEEFVCANSIFELYMLIT